MTRFAADGFVAVHEHAIVEHGDARGLNQLAVREHRRGENNIVALPLTGRPRHAMQGADGTLIEVFEWASAEAIERAHANPAVLALWAAFEAACDYVPLASLAEASQLFAEFTPLAPRAPQTPGGSPA